MSEIIKFPTVPREPFSIPAIPINTPREDLPRVLSEYRKLLAEHADHLRRLESGNKIIPFRKP